MYHFIVNPNSRSGLGLSLWAQIEPELQKRKIDYTVFFTVDSASAAVTVLRILYSRRDWRTLLENH